MANKKAKTMRELKAQFAHEMDVFVRENIDDDDIFIFWLAEGVPDGADEDYLYDLLECPGVWENICECFGKICKAAGFIKESEVE